MADAPRSLRSANLIYDWNEIGQRGRLIPPNVMFEDMSEMLVNYLPTFIY